MDKVFSVPGIGTADEKRLQQIENIIGYTFKHRPFLLKAITHSSDVRDESTDSSLGHYENFEFLGAKVKNI